MTIYVINSKVVNVKFIALSLLGVWQMSVNVSANQSPCSRWNQPGYSIINYDFLKGQHGAACSN